MGDTGPELSQVSVPATPISEISCAHCAQSEAADGGIRRQTVLPEGASEHELKRIGAAWSKLPENIRAAILALVEPFSKRESDGK